MPTSLRGSGREASRHVLSQPFDAGPAAHGEDWLGEDLDLELELEEVAELEY